jgi:hypothetical protein
LPFNVIKLGAKSQWLPASEENANGQKPCFYFIKSWFIQKIIRTFAHSQSARLDYKLF